MPWTIQAVEGERCDHAASDCALQANHHARQSNRLEQIQSRGPTSVKRGKRRARQVTVCVGASMLDYIVDDATGGLVEGSRSVPQQVEEFWTFARRWVPAPGSCRLSRLGRPTVL